MDDASVVFSRKRFFQTMIYTQLPAFLDDEQRHQFLMFTDDGTLHKLVRWMNVLAEKLE